MSLPPPPSADVTVAAAPRIRVLPPELANQIAAGEVVERPASVVKELVENALDAGARRIDIEVEGGGRRLVRVVDDAGGMTRAEAELALIRHATSKLVRFEELYSLDTMGFRGEALPSIAAVSRMELVTRTAADVAGWRLALDGGERRDAGEVGCPVGTQITVRDLLHNVPARLKFLKADATEAAHVTEAVTRLALVHPGTHFRLRHGGRIALDLPPHPSLGERVRAVLGRGVGARLHEATHEESGVRVALFLAPPDEAQTTSRGIWLYAGRRFVRDRGLLHAVAMGYGELVPRGRYATAVVLVEVPPGTVDINVHPQKVEVRFARAQEVVGAVRHGVSQAIARAPWLTGPTRAASSVAMVAVTSLGPPAERAVSSDLAGRYADHQASLFGGVRLDANAMRREQGRPAASRDPMGESASVALDATTAGAPGTSGTSVTSGTSGTSVTLPARADASTFFGRLTYLGQLDLTYLVCEAAGELVLLDQHAAHERIAFQRLRDAHAENRVPTQRLLFPMTLELEPALLAAVVEAGPALLACGYEVEPLSGRTVAVRSRPAELSEDEVVPTLRELLSELAATDASRAVAERLDRLFATVACHSVVRAGDLLAPDEARALLSALDGVDFKAHCPHGRPVLLRIDLAEIARRFGRT